MKTTELRHGTTVYRLEIVSNTMADVIVEQDGKVLEKRQYTGARAAVLAQITWNRLTGLVGGPAA